jgi:transcriptional regulator with PAS, ATPase and Fis domain
MTNAKKILGNTPALKVLLHEVKTIAKTDATVLISGETGTGKELIAIALQQKSLRAQEVFITLNCAALSPELLEPTLFGYLRGSFTNADEDALGIIAAADKGTLFLDEINSMSLVLQAKLLRFIQNGEYLPVGAVNTCKADVRLIVATNAPILQLIELGQFRADLYYRLSIFVLDIPPLRERIEDIGLLLNHYLCYFAAKYELRTMVIKKDALAILEKYAWPGNIRELRNLCENLTISKFRHIIGCDDLPLKYRQTGCPCKVLYLKLPEEGLDWYQLEQSLIEQALKLAEGNVSQAADLLGLSRHALYYRIRKWGLYENAGLV